MCTIINAGVMDTMIDVAHVPSILALPTASFGLVTSQKQKALPKGTDVGAARPAALCLVTAPAAEPSKGSQGEGLGGGQSEQGEKGE